MANPIIKAIITVNIIFKNVGFITPSPPLKASSLKFYHLFLYSAFAFTFDLIPMKTIIAIIEITAISPGIKPVPTLPSVISVPI